MSWELSNRWTHLEWACEKSKPVAAVSPIGIQLTLCCDAKTEPPSSLFPATLQQCLLERLFVNPDLMCEQSTPDEASFRLPLQLQSYFWHYQLPGLVLYQQYPSQHCVINWILWSLRYDPLAPSPERYGVLWSSHRNRLHMMSGIKCYCHSLCIWQLFFNFFLCFIVQLWHAFVGEMLSTWYLVPRL